ncbi:MAG: hypothetical protein ACREMY_02165 [bacterium]
MPHPPKPPSQLAKDLRARNERVRKLKSQAIQQAVDVRPDYDDFIRALLAKLRGK